MAKCASCGRDVGCGCNLIDGVCATCYGEGLGNNGVNKPAKRNTRIVYPKPQTPPPNTEFSQILKTKGISQEEKIKRINDILEAAINKQNGTNV